MASGNVATWRRGGRGGGGRGQRVREKGIKSLKVRLYFACRVSADAARAYIACAGPVRTF